MRRIAVLVVLLLLVSALVVPSIATANPEAGQGCHCHKMYGQAAADGLHNAFVKSNGKNAKATPCAFCHAG